MSFFEINRKGIILLLNEKLHLSDSRHLKGQHVHIAIKMLKVQDGT